MDGKGERHSGCNNFPFTPVFETHKWGSGGSASRWGLSSTPPTLAPLPSDPGDATGQNPTILISKKSKKFLGRREIFLIFFYSKMVGFVHFGGFIYSQHPPRPPSSHPSRRRQRLELDAFGVLSLPPYVKSWLPRLYSGFLRSRRYACMLSAMGLFPSVYGDIRLKNLDLDT